MRHVGTEKNNLNGIGTVDGEQKNDDEDTPLVDADLADVLVQVFLRHSAALRSLQPSSRCLNAGSREREINSSGI